MNRAADALFPKDKSVETSNLKFFLGSNRSVTAEQLADQLNRADAQVREGIAVPAKTLDGDMPTKKLGG
jgi:hypothetical protein